eukprot:CAMPEP_0113617732 /NCGR_PEP_ID=MMETSP0017_2-20120614/8945_1 /TAXON_ID=2856 /ORGANISM="Cylindrotheca closterium" /LENGTH=265 /DNA_ID=CAMNT_0000527163 /DNA_START=137 /DNA_END=937 /DNA_ORIENTATION=- /assembly_acc=CAM_ASM_000147
MGTVASFISSSSSTTSTTPISVTALTTASQPSKPKTSKRLFIAVELPDDAKDLCLETITDKLLPLDKPTPENEKSSVKWVLDPSLFHCTLQFLGSVKDDQIRDLSDQLRKQVQSITPFTLQLGGLGCFPNRKSTKNASVVWLGLEGDTQELKDLSSVVMDTTEPLGFRRERRPFSAHITLGRVKRRIGGGGRRKRGRGQEPQNSSSFPTALQDQIEKMMNIDHNEATETKSTCSFQVNHVSLMESKLSKRGPEYITLERFDLRKS